MARPHGIPGEPDSDALKDWKRNQAKKAGHLFRTTVESARKRAKALPPGF